MRTRQFEEVQSNVYKVTKVQVAEDFVNMDLLKNIPTSELIYRDFAFFKVRDGEIWITEWSNRWKKYKGEKQPLTLMNSEEIHETWKPWCRGIYRSPVF